MFIYNLKLNEKHLLKYFFIVILIIILFIFSVGIYKIFFDSKNTYKNNDEQISLSDTLKTDEIFEITENNYATILQTVHNNIDSYIGCKIHFTGYVYRLIDFEEDKFVLARDMIIDKNTSQSLVVGFLCTYKNAKQFDDYTWVDVTGEITKGDYYGEIAVVNITQIHECNEPENKFVSMPDSTYIPTSGVL